MIAIAIALLGSSAAAGELPLRLPHKECGAPGMFPSPLWGGVRGGGDHTANSCIWLTPLPNPPPRELGFTRVRQHIWPKADISAFGWGREQIEFVASADRNSPERAVDPAGLSSLVRQDCGSCHGLTLKGGLGRPLTPDRLSQWDGEQLTQIILDGIPGTPMPPWRALLTQAEARWIAEALKSGNLR